MDITLECSSGDGAVADMTKAGVRIIQKPFALCGPAAGVWDMLDVKRSVSP